MVTNVIQPISNNIRLIKPDGTATDFFIRWAQTRQIDIANGITAAQAQQLIDDWAADRDIIAGTALTGGGDLSSDVTINHADSPVTPGTYGDTTNVPQITVDQQGHITDVVDIPISMSTGTVTSVDGSSSASGFTLTGGPITTSGTLTFNISNAGNARTSLGLAIGTDVQAFSAKLAAYAGGDTPSTFTLGIVDAVDAAAWRAAIGAGTGTGSVTSVDVSGGTTGLTATGGPITTSGTITLTGGAALTKTDDTNVTLTLGGTPTTALLKATSITVGWTGTLSVARGGTGSGTVSGARTNLSVPEYTTGTYAPTVAPQSGTFTTVSATGSWKRVGNIVTVAVNVNINAVGTATGYVTVTLPFAGSAGLTQVSVGRENLVTGNGLFAIINPSDTVFYCFTIANTSPIVPGAGFVFTIVYFV